MKDCYAIEYENSCGTIFYEFFMGDYREPAINKLEV